MQILIDKIDKNTSQYLRFQIYEIGFKAYCTFTEKNVCLNQTNICLTSIIEKICLIQIKFA